MRTLGWLARCVGRTGFAKRAVAESADLGIFQGRPATRLVMGLVVFALNFLLGWPVVAALGVAALWTESPLLLLFGAPIAYAFSWFLFGLGVLLVGPDSARYLRALVRWAVRRWVERAGGVENRG
ncbi:MAG: hypothetical protein ABIK09_07685 [Pseudomonadota bacterium]